MILVNIVLLAPLGDRLPFRAGLALLDDGLPVSKANFMGTCIHCDLLFKKLTLILSFLKYATGKTFKEGARFDVYDGQKPTEEKYVFVNAYDAVGGLKLNAEKTYKNGTLRGGEFTFELRDADGKVLQSRKNDAAGHVYFEPLDYEHCHSKS